MHRVFRRAGFRALLSALLVGTLLPMATIAAQEAPPAPAEPVCQLGTGFAALRSAIAAYEERDVTGDCFGIEEFDGDGDAWQGAENGLFIWVKAQNATAFSNGTYTWRQTPRGIQKAHVAADPPLDLRDAVGMVPGASYLFTLLADVAAFDPPDGPATGRFHLTLGGTRTTTVAFSDHPYRDAFVLPTRNFVGLWHEMGFDDDPPNAALVVEGAPEGEDVLIVQIANPLYHPASGRLTFEAQIIPERSVGGASLSHFFQRADQSLPAAVGPVSLFIDSAGVPAAAATPQPAATHTPTPIPAPGTPTPVPQATPAPASAQRAPTPTPGPPAKVDPAKDDQLVGCFIGCHHGGGGLPVPAPPVPVPPIPPLPFPTSPDLPPGIRTLVPTLPVPIPSVDPRILCTVTLDQGLSSVSDRAMPIPMRSCGLSATTNGYYLFGTQGPGARRYNTATMWMPWNPTETTCSGRTYNFTLSHTSQGLPTLPAVVESTFGKSVRGVYDSLQNTLGDFSVVVAYNTYTQDSQLYLLTPNPHDVSQPLANSLAAPLQDTLGWVAPNIIVAPSATFRTAVRGMNYALRPDCSTMVVFWYLFGTSGVSIN